jgi:hypothetical protein
MIKKGVSAKAVNADLQTIADRLKLIHKDDYPERFGWVSGDDLATDDCGQAGRLPLFSPRARCRPSRPMHYSTVRPLFFPIQ